MQIISIFLYYLTFMDSIYININIIVGNNNEQRTALNTTVNKQLIGPIHLSAKAKRESNRYCVFTT